MKSIIISILFVGMCSCQTPLPNEIINTNYEIQSESKQPIYFLVSEPTQNDGKPLDKDNFYVTTEIIRTFLKVADSSQKIAFIGSTPHWQQLQYTIGSTPSLIHIESAPYHWLQDMFEVFRAPDGNIALGVPWPNKMFISNAEQIAKSLNGKAFLIPQQTPPIRTIDGDIPGPGFNLMGIHGTVGGNVERWTKDIGFIGSSDFPTDSQAHQFSQTIFPNNLKRWILPTSFLYLGHIDEVVKPIFFEKIDSPQNCSITALIANPILGLQLLQKNPQSKLLDSTGLQKSKITDYEAFKTLCKKANITNCNLTRWSDITKSTDFNKEFQKTQKLVFEQQQLTRTMIEDAYRGSCKIDWIDVPQIYIAEIDNDKIKRRSAGGIYSNLTNGVVVGNTYITVAPGLNIFKNYLQREFAKRQKPIEFINANGYFLGGFRSAGHLHCMTQVIR